ncbi:MAG: hypothetical protein IPP82_14275 [Xanthomonadales bacterium]|nr:hypothetical protein [Xanthomonadales bacterium]
MSTNANFCLHDEPAVLATMHGKERVIAPLLKRMLGLQVSVPIDFDTDRFGSFSRQVARTVSAIDAARAKIAAAFERSPAVRIGLASEGSFGPHPSVPFVVFGSEIVLLIDRESGLELVGYHCAPATHYSRQIVSELSAAKAFARRIDFPRHGVIVMGVVGAEPNPFSMLFKNITTESQFEQAVTRTIERDGCASVETDMRAHRNQTRMRAIKRATIHLIRAWQARCPSCDRPGFVVSDRLSGLPCAWCDEPTEETRATLSRCKGCDHVFENPVRLARAEPGHCRHCNP